MCETHLLNASLQAGGQRDEGYRNAIRDCHCAGRLLGCQMRNASQMENGTNVRPRRPSIYALGGSWASARLLFTVLVSCIILNGFEPRLASADQTSSGNGFIRLDREIQTLKKEFLELNSELLLLEEELLYPPDQKLVVFVSVTKGTLVTPSLVQIELDGEMLVHHLYTDSEIEALQRGGVQRLYVGKVGMGDHAFEVSLTGTQRKGRDFHRVTTKDFSRWHGPTYVELRIEGTETKEGPEFRIYVW